MPQNITVELFLNGLKERLSEDNRISLSYATGASSKQLTQLKKRYPHCPEALLDLLANINGTYWQKYGNHTITVLMLGSDVFEYPYYLKSVEQILEEDNNGNSINEIYGDYIDDDPELVDEAIDPDVNIDLWLCFSDCMNNGGTSRLYIDFNPSKTGKKGQVVRYLHDPDSYKVIAESFDEYLQMLINDNYSFLIADE
jgi:SMI1 / KNR4 family (SUKH-1)